MQRRYATRAAILAAFTAVAMGAAQSSRADPINVTVNGAPVTFTGTPPMEQNNAVLVPLRGVFEAMGATVDYDAASKTINARKGSSYVVLPLGAVEATVNGRTETLAQPATVVDGTTLVPLRFVAEALGAYVDWHQATSTVAIKTGEPHLATLPAPHGRTVTGQLTGIYTNTVPEQITLRVNGQNTAIPLTPDTIVLRSEPDQPGMQVRIDQLSVGDQVTVRRDTDGAALSVTANYGEVHGTLKSVGRLANGDRVLTLNDGTTVELAPGAGVTMDGRKIELGDVLPDETVRISTNPSTALGYHVYVNPEGPDGGRHNGPAPSVTSFSVDARGPIRDGEKLVATLTGTPGGQATFSIPGVVDAVPMSEVSPGVYRGSYTVQPGLSVQNASVLGRLQANGQTAPLIQANSPVSIQSVAPRISSVSPAKGSTVQIDRPLIYGTISDAAGGIDAGKTRVTLDGHDVTADATVTPQFFNLRPSNPLQPGDHTVRVSVADGAGNTAEREWTFRVSSEKFVTSFTSDTDPNAVLGAGSRIRFTLNGQPGGQASVTVPGIARDVPLRETSPGVYTGEYTIAQGQNASGVPATARFVAPGGDVVTQTLSQDLRIAAGQPAAPTIVEPGDGTDVGRTVTVRGKAAPGATVRVKVNYTSSGLGGLLNLSGSAGTQEVTADDRGSWEVKDLPLTTDSLLANAGSMQYQIVATTVNAAGESSPETVLDIRGGRVYAHRSQ